MYLEILYQSWNTHIISINIKKVKKLFVFYVCKRKSNAFLTGCGLAKKSRDVRIPVIAREFIYILGQHWLHLTDDIFRARSFPVLFPGHFLLRYLDPSGPPRKLIPEMISPNYKSFGLDDLPCDCSDFLRATLGSIVRDSTEHRGNKVH